MLPADLNSKMRHLTLHRHLDGVDEPLKSLLCPYLGIIPDQFLKVGQGRRKRSGHGRTTFQSKWLSEHLFLQNFPGVVSQADHFYFAPAGPVGVDYKPISTIKDRLQNYLLLNKTLPINGETLQSMFYSTRRLGLESFAEKIHGHIVSPPQLPVSLKHM